MDKECELRKSHGEHVRCDEGACVFWRAVRHLDDGAVSAAGCAVQHFELLGDEERVRWLLSVRERWAQTVGMPLAEPSTGVAGGAA